MAPQGTQGSGFMDLGGGGPNLRRPSRGRLLRVYETTQIDDMIRDMKNGKSYGQKCDVSR